MANNDCTSWMQTIYPSLSGTPASSSGTYCCGINGVSCSDNGLSILQINLSNKSLTGRLPPEIESLTHLTVLNLSYNQLTGVLPSNIQQMVALQSLYLQNNSISGTIPNSIGSCTNLTAIDFSNNKLTGGYPKEISNLKSLSVLNLFGNYLSGTIPIEIQGMPNFGNFNITTQSNQQTISNSSSNNSSLLNGIIIGIALVIVLTCILFLYWLLVIRRKRLAHEQGMRTVNTDLDHRSNSKREPSIYVFPENRDIYSSQATFSDLPTSPNAFAPLLPVTKDTNYLNSPVYKPGFAPHQSSYYNYEMDYLQHTYPQQLVGPSQETFSPRNIYNQSQPNLNVYQSMIQVLPEQNVCASPMVDVDVMPPKLDVENESELPHLKEKVKKYVESLTIKGNMKAVFEKYGEDGVTISSGMQSHPAHPENSTDNKSEVSSADGRAKSTSLEALSNALKMPSKRLEESLLKSPIASQVSISNSPFVDPNLPLKPEITPAISSPQAKLDTIYEEPCHALPDIEGMLFERSDSVDSRSVNTPNSVSASNLSRWSNIEMPFIMKKRFEENVTPDIWQNGIPNKIIFFAHGENAVQIFASFVQFLVFKSNIIRRAVFQFTPTKDDEIAVNIGDELEIERHLFNGFCFGNNITTASEGLFPAKCIEPPFSPVLELVYVNTINSTPIETPQKVLYASQTFPNLVHIQRLRSNVNAINEKLQQVISDTGNKIKIILCGDSQVCHYLETNLLIGDPKLDLSVISEDYDIKSGKYPTFLTC